MSLLGKLAIFILAILVSFHYNIHKDRVKLATFKIKLPQLAKMAKISADEYFSRVGYVIKENFLVWLWGQDANC